MPNPRDFLPAKYKKLLDSVENLPVKNHVSDAKVTERTSSKNIKTDSPWSDLAKEPKNPEYRSNLTLDNDGIKNELTANDKIPELETVKQQQFTTPASPPQKKASNSKKSNKLAGLLVVFFLVIGVFTSYFLTKQNQDLRQQASTSCDAGDPYCGANGSCLSGYKMVDGECVSNNVTVTPTSCGDNMHMIDGNCVHETCRKLANGDILCGYITDQDPCTEESMGGDWCDDPNTIKVETCEEADLIRCQCSGGWWTIGKADSCSELCSDANADCPTCSTTPKPTSPPKPPKTPTPTPPPQSLACGEFNCVQNSDCQNGLTCQAVIVDGEDKKICSKGENQLFCAANPTTANCCESQPMPVCASIEMLDASNNLMEEDDDKTLKPSDEVRFRCSAVGNQDIDFDYEFRIWDTSTTIWTNITDISNTVAKNVSDLYTISNFGKYIVQGRICWGNECQVWEIIEGAPENIADETAGGDDVGDTNDVSNPDDTSDVSNPDDIEWRDRVKGISCQTNADCSKGYTCYQPPVPACPTGMFCTQGMPDKYCIKK